MRLTKEALRNPEIDGAATNYEKALTIPGQSQVLIVTDRFNRDRFSPGSREKHTRFQIATQLYRSLRDKTHRLANFYIEEGKEEGELAEMTRIVLNTLDAQEKGAGDPTTTVVYMAGNYPGRQGVIDAASIFGWKRKVRLADSTDFSELDCSVMSKLDENKQSEIIRWYNYFNNFFETHSYGMLTLGTTDIKEQQHMLRFPYHGKKTPLRKNLGLLGRNNFTTFHGKQIEQEHLPGGSIAIPTHDTQVISGTIAAAGLVFHVNLGCISKVDIVDDRIAQLSKNQQALLEQIQHGARIPVTEMGLGLLGMAGIQTYPEKNKLNPTFDRINIGLGSAAFVCEVPELQLDSDVYSDSYLYSTRFHTAI